MVARCSSCNCTIGRLCQRAAEGRSRAGVAAAAVAMESGTYRSKNRSSGALGAPLDVAKLPHLFERGRAHAALL